MPHLLSALPANEEKDDIWCGWGKYYPTEQEMSLLYTDPQMNILKCKTNEFVKIYEG